MNIIEKIFDSVSCILGCLFFGGFMLVLILSAGLSVAFVLLGIPAMVYKAYF